MLGKKGVDMDAQAQIRELLDGFEGEAAFLARNLGTGAEFGYRDERVMPTASTIKIVVLAELFRQVETGADRSGYDG